jgi:hypothetical protein
MKTTKAIRDLKREEINAICNDNSDCYKCPLFFNDGNCLACAERDKRDDIRDDILAKIGDNMVETAEVEMTRADRIQQIMKSKPDNGMPFQIPGACIDCNRAEWDELYGTMVYGCNMGLSCIADGDDY